MDKLERLISEPEKFIDSLYRVQVDIYREALKYIKALDVKNGRILLNKRNLSILAEFNNWYTAVIEKSGFYDRLTVFLNEFDKQGTITADYFRKEFGNVILSELTQQIIEQKKLLTAEIFINSIIDSDFKFVIKNHVTNAVLGKSTFSETLNTLQTIITGDDRLDGKLVQYSKQVAYDSFVIADRTYTHAIAEALNAEWFKYSGGKRAGTRPFCLSRFNEFFHKKEVESWASLDWQGKIEGTEKNTIFDFAGGYNCKHSILPVSVFSVPEEVINRNIKNGNYKPTKEELAALKN